MRIGLAVHTNTNAWIAEINVGKLSTSGRCVQLYLAINKELAMFKV